MSRAASPQALRAPVLMYHGLHRTPDDRGRFDPVYSVQPEAFARQLDWLLANGYRSVRGMDEAASGTGRPVLITFDDGDGSNIEVALPLLRERGMVALFLVTSDFIGQPGMLLPAEVRALADAGMAIGAHGRSHAFLEDLDAVALAAELHDSRACLSAVTGRAVDALALPGGRGGAREWRAAIGAGYRDLYGSVPGTNRLPATEGWLQRIAVRRDTGLETFAALVGWCGWTPRWARARHLALAVPKRMLGNRAYQRLRSRLL